MANLRASDGNCTVRSSGVNSAVSCRRIAFEAGLKDHIFLHFLSILARENLPGGAQKWTFFVTLEPFHSTTFCSGNVSFQLENPTPEWHLSEKKICFFGCSVLRRQQIPYQTGVKNLPCLLQWNCSPPEFKRPFFSSKLRKILRIR